MPAMEMCRCCGRPRTRRGDGRGWNGAHGWCSACTERWRVAGKPPEGPPAPPSATERAARISAGLRRWHATHSQSQAARAALAATNPWRWEGMFTDYAWLRSFGELIEDAARRAGVSVRTARWVYEPMLARHPEEDTDAA